MNKTKWILITLATSLLIVVSATATQATVLRAFVSSTGNDANAASNCPQATPCKTFAGALPTVTAGGELIALDTAGYGPLTGANSINKAITIAAVPGARAFVVAATSTAGFTINGAAGDQITLRNISFNGNGATNTTGVLNISGKLLIDNCSFSQLTTAGVQIGGSGKSLIQNSFFSGNAVGVSVFSAKVIAENLTVSSNTIGYFADGDGGSQNAPPTGATSLEINGGIVVNNGTAFSMNNPGLHNGGQGLCNGVNIYIGGNGQILVRQNNVFAAVTGSSDHQAGCGAQVSVGGLNNQTSPP